MTHIDRLLAAEDHIRAAIAEIEAVLRRDPVPETNPLSRQVSTLTATLRDLIFSTDDERRRAERALGGPIYHSNSLPR